MERLSTLITRHPKGIIAAWIVLTLGFASGALRLTSRNNYDGELPLTDPTVAEQKQFEEAFGDEQTMLVAVKSPDLLSDRTLDKIERLTSDLSQITGVPEAGVTGLATITIDPWDPNTSTVLQAVRQSASDQRHALLDRLPQTAGFLSDDRTSTLIAAQVSRTAPQSEVAARVEALRASYAGPEQIYVIGDHTVAQAIDEGIESDLGMLLPLAFVLILAVLWFCFGRVQSALLPACVMIGSIVWTLGLMGHLGVPLNVVTSTLPILLVAVASSYGIHVVRQQSVLSGKDRTRQLLKDLGRPVLLTGMTSAAGALSLLVFEVQSIREFGIFAALGITSATLSALIFLPAALALTSDSTKKFELSEKLSHLLAAAGRGSLAHRHLVIGLMMIAVVTSIVGIARIRIGMDPVSMFPQGHPVREATTVLNTEFAGCRYFDVMIDGRHAGAALESGAMEAVNAFAQEVRDLPGVTAVTSVVDLVPQGAVGPALIPMLRASGLIDEAGRRSRITVMTTATDQEQQTLIYDRLRFAADCHFSHLWDISFGGPVLRWIAQNRYVSIGKVLSVVAASIFVFLACMAAFRSARAGALASLPLAISTITTFGVMGWTGIRLNMATAITTAIGLGIGVDFGIHFLTRLRHEMASRATEDAVVRTMITTGRAVIYDVISNVVGFGVLIFSVFGPVRDFGWLISLTMITSAAGTLIILPAAAVWLRAPRPQMARVVQTHRTLEAV
jgi:uncharacterized protein